MEDNKSTSFIFLMQRISDLKYINLLEQCLILYMVRSICVSYFHFSIYLYSVFYIYLLVYICCLYLPNIEFFFTLEGVLPDKDPKVTLIQRSK